MGGPKTSCAFRQTLLIDIDIRTLPWGQKCALPVGVMPRKVLLDARIMARREKGVGVGVGVGELLV